MAYTAWSVVYGEQPTAAKWNQLGTNDAGFKDGTNIDNDAIINRHIGDDAVGMREFSNPYTFRAYKSSAQNTTNGAFAKVLFNVESFDSNSNYDNATNYRFVAPVAGRYYFGGGVCIGAGALAIVIVSLFKNGTEYGRGTDHRLSATNRLAITGDFIELAANDYVEIHIFADGATALDVSAVHLTRFYGFMVDRT